MSCSEHDEIKEDISNLNNSFADFKESVLRLTLSIEKLGETTVSLQQYYEQNHDMMSQFTQMKIDIDKLKVWLRVIAIGGIISVCILAGLHGISLPQLL